MIQNRKHYGCATRSTLPADRWWTFRVYMMPLRNLVPEWNSRPGATNGVNSRRHDILWWYHINKCRAMRGNRSELAPARKSPRCHVNTPLLRYAKNASFFNRRYTNGIPFLSKIVYKVGNGFGRCCGSFPYKSPAQKTDRLSAARKFRYLFGPGKLFSVCHVQD